MRSFIAISAAATAILGLAAVFTVSSAPAAPSLAALIAPPAACPGASRADVTAARQERQMLCMTNYARRREGLTPLSGSVVLDRSAIHKSADILRCGSFSHEACGRPFTYWMERVGYLPAPCWRVGENIAWGTGSLGTVRSIFSAWINSPGHRENILGRYRQIGIGLRVGGLDDQAAAHVWTQEFGAHC